MAVQAKPVLSDNDLNDTDREILELLREGRVTPPFVSERLDKSREYASERLIRLNEHDHTDRPAPGLYELVDDPLGEVGPTLQDVREERDQLADDLEEARGEINALAEEVETLQDQLAAAPNRGEIEAAIGDLEAACEQGDRNGVDVALDRLREAAGIDDGE